MTGAAERIAAVVQGCALVIGLHAGRSGTIATGVGRDRLVGVRRDRENIVVGVIGRTGVNSVEIVGQVRAAVAVIEPEANVSVRVEARDPGV